MIRREEVIAFFDGRAPRWDEEMIRNDAVIGQLLTNASVTAGKRVLDVACGTGVLIPDYLSRGACVTGIDISPEMIRIAKRKFADNPSVRLVTGDAESFSSDIPFDTVMVYNAFPHFPDPERLIANLASLLPAGGILSVAHGMSRHRINAHHTGAAEHVSLGLMPAAELKRLFLPLFDVTVCIDSEEMYQVAGVRKGGV